MSEQFSPSTRPTQRPDVHRSVGPPKIRLWQTWSAASWLRALPRARAARAQRTDVVVAPLNSIVPTSLAVSPDRVTGGTTATAIITLNGPAPAGGAVVALSTRRRNILTMPGSVTVPEGATAATFTVATDPVHGNARVAEIDAAYNGITVTATLTVEPSPRAATPTQAVALCASVALEPCLTRAAFEAVVNTSTLYEQRFTLYSPELTLLAETAPTIGQTHTIAYEYVWFAGQPLAQINSATGAIDWYFNDHLGTPILQTDAAARMVWQPEYDTYGAVLAFRRGEAKHQPLRFPGQTAEAGTELSYNVFRWYRAGWGRYTQSDPLDTQIAGVINNYHYALSNPGRFIDPTGLETTHSSDRINCIANPIDCARIRHCAEEARTTALAKFHYERDGTPQNAYKHCYWNCCMAKIIGPTEAKKFGDAHENYPGNPRCSMNQDLWNNEQGRRVTGATTCDSHCGTAALQDWSNCRPCREINPLLGTRP